MGDTRVGRTFAPEAANLDSWSRHAWTDGLQIEGLPALDCLRVQTRNTVYEITVTAPHAGEILVRGGRFFPVFTPVVLAGASLGGSFLKRHGIYVGFHMELVQESQTLVTTRVQSIARTSFGRLQ
jgi:hypothetical protein